MWYTLQPDEVRRARVSISPYGTISTEFFGNLPRTTGKTIYVSDNQDNLDSQISTLTLMNPNNNLFGSKLFLSKQCTTSRELIRQSGYKIVRDKENADYVVLPNIFSKADTWPYNVAILHESSDKTILWLCDVRKYSNSSGYRANTPEEGQRIIDALKRAFHNDDVLTFYYSTLLNDQVATISRKCPDMEELFVHGDTIGALYIMENRLPLKALSNFSVENMKLWAKEGDIRILDKIICGSDWKEYPFTTAIFLKSQLPYLLRSQLSAQFCNILDEIEYDSLTLEDYSISQWKYSKPISPKDWALAQEFLLDIIGIKDKGYTDRFPSWYSALIRSKRVVASTSIPEPMLYKDLLKMIDIFSK